MSKTTLTSLVGRSVGSLVGWFGMFAYRENMFPFLSLALIITFHTQTKSVKYFHLKSLIRKSRNPQNVRFCVIRIRVRPYAHFYYCIITNLSELIGLVQ